MGLFDSIFKSKEVKYAEKSSSQFTFFSGNNSYFTPASGNIYDTAEIRSVIHAFANACAKLRLEVFGSARPDLKSVLKYKPNEFMDLPKFLYVTATILSINNTVFITPVKDLGGRLIGYYPIAPTMCEVVEINGEVYIKCQFGDGKKAAFPYRQIGIITDYQNSDFFGEDNNSLKSIINIINTQNQGLVKGIKNSANIRFIGRVGHILDDNALNKKRESINKNNFSKDNNNGMLIVDNSVEDLKEVTSRPYLLDAELQKSIHDAVYKYFGVPEHIVKGDFTESQMTAFFESKLEPFAIKLTSALTNMTFTDRELALGNGITYTTSKFDFASIETKLDIATKAVDRGFFTPNEARELMDLPPIEGGDELIRKLDYAPIKNGGDKNGD